VLVHLRESLESSRRAAAAQAGLPQLLPHALTLRFAPGDFVEHLSHRQESVLAELRGRLGDQVHVVMEVAPDVPVHTVDLRWSWSTPAAPPSHARAFLVSDSGNAAWTRGAPEATTPQLGWAELAWQEGGRQRREPLTGANASFGRFGGDDTATVMARADGADAADMRIVSGRSLLLTPTPDGRGVRVDNVGRNEVRLPEAGGIVLERYARAVIQGEATLRWRRARGGADGFALTLRPRPRVVVRWEHAGVKGDALILPVPAVVPVAPGVSISLALDTLAQGWFAWHLTAGGDDDFGMYEGGGPWIGECGRLRVEVAWITGG
jgi:hypothetical protein